MCQGRPIEWLSVHRGGETEEEILQKAAEHAKEHGICEVTPELIDRVKANIRDA